MRPENSGEPPGPLALFCARLKLVQVASGISQASLAGAVHLGRSQMSDILNGKIKRRPGWDVTIATVRACLECAESRGRIVSPDLRDEEDWRRRYADLESDLDAWPESRSRRDAKTANAFGGSPSLDRAAGVQVGSGNFQFNSYYYGDQTRTPTGTAAPKPASGAADSPHRGHAFISYVREDSDRVNELQRMLEAAGIPVWRDTVSLWPGEDWNAKIREAITRDALAFIACFSGHSTARRMSYMNEELTLAVGQLRLRQPDVPWLIPVRLSDCTVPDLDLGAGRTLRSIHTVDLFGETAQAGTMRLVGAVLRILGRHWSEPMAGATAAIQRAPQRPVIADAPLTAISSPPIFPVYMVVEESSAVDGTPVADLNAGILELCAEIASNPVVADKMRFCLIGFSNQAHVLLPLSNLSEVSVIPGLAAGGSASYGAAFDLLRATIDQDARDLIAGGHKILHPYVFFVAASPPTDPEDWPAAHERATDSKWQYYPNIIAFGFRGADGDTLKRIATIRAFLSTEINPIPVLRQYTQSLMQSIVRSVASPPPGGGIRLVMPDMLPGYTVVNADPT